MAGCIIQFKYYPKFDLLEGSRRGSGVLEVSGANILICIKRASGRENDWCSCSCCWCRELDIGVGNSVEEHGNKDEVDDDGEDAADADDCCYNAASIRFLFLLDDNWSRSSLWWWWWSIG